MSQPDRPIGGESMTHSPVPYIVRVRVVRDEDSAPDVREYKLTAYSLIEAMLQATIQAGGSTFDDSKVKVEHIEPDVPAYMAALVKRALDAMGHAPSVRKDAK